MSPPNVIYFISHDTGRFLGCYDRPITWTPHLDAFAREAVQFDRAYCSAPCCGPSRNCAMTGKYSHVTGTLGLGGMGWTLPSHEQTVVDYMNGAGYETVHIGFCHERLYGEMRYHVDGQRGVNERYWNCDARNVVDCAIEYLAHRDGRRPVYMNLATNETHASYICHQPSERHGGAVPRESVWVPPTLPDLPEIRRDWANWYSSLRYVDAQFGRLMHALDERGMRDNTLVVYTTDHGTGGMRGKGQLYQQGVEIALLVRPPNGYRTGYRVRHLIPNIDFMPTWLEACGMAVPDGINGRSFWPLIAGQDYTPHDYIFLERNFHGEWREPRANAFVDKYDPQRSVVTQDMQYIGNMRPAARARCWCRHEITSYEQVAGKKEGVLLPLPHEERPAEELYDLRHDPWNQWDVAGRPEYADMQRELRSTLEAWMEATNDPALRPEMPAPLDQPVHWPTRDRVCDVERC